MRTRAAFCVLTLALAGCVDRRAGFPSLAPRAIEQQGFEEPAAPPPAAIAADPALDAAIAQAEASLADVTRRFDAAARSARTQTAKSGSAGSDAWLDAQVALAGLDAIQAEATDVLSGLEDRAMARAADGAAPYPALEAAVTVARARIEAQRSTIAAIGAGLAPV